MWSAAGLHEGEVNALPMTCRGRTLQQAQVQLDHDHDNDSTPIADARHDERTHG